MFTEVYIDSKIEIPYKIIDISENTEQFILSFKSFDSNQTDYSINLGGVTGEFEIIYNCNGIKSQFEIDVTIGNMYTFYVQLEKAYECLCEANNVAILENYGSLDRANMSFEFDKKGHIIVKSKFMNKNTLYKSGISFEMQIETWDVHNILICLHHFFEELKRIQGHSKFY